MKRWTHIFLTMGLVAMMAMTVGCFHEDDDTDAGPTEPVISDFNESTAVLMADFYAESAAENIDQVLILTTAIPRAAVSPPADAVWNDTDMRWEWAETIDVDGLSLTATISLQYIDDQGDPQELEDGAVSLRYLFSAVGTQDQGSAGTLSLEYSGDIDIDNLNDLGEPVLMHGNGSNVVIIDLSFGGLSTSTEYTATWETDASGVSVPTDGGCPTGIIIYTMDPFTMNIVFNGNDVYVYSMMDAAQTPVDLDPAIDGLQELIELDLDCGN